MVLNPQAALIYQILEISDLQRHRIAIMHYNGDILSLWLYLSTMFEPYDEAFLYAASTLMLTPYLAELLLRHIECSLLIAILDSSLFATLDMDQVDLVHRLICLGGMDTLNAGYRVRATAMRILATVDWDSGEVWEGWASPEDGEDPPQHVLQDKVLDEIEAAIRLHEEHETGNATLLYYAQAFVQKSFNLPFIDSWNIAWSERNPFDIDHGNLLLTFSYIVFTTRVYVKLGASLDVRECIRNIEQAKLLGQWGRMFSEWWVGEEKDLASKEVWKKEWKARQLGFYEPQQEAPPLHLCLNKLIDSAVQLAQSPLPVTPVRETYQQIPLSPTSSRPAVTSMPQHQRGPQNFIATTAPQEPLKITQTGGLLRKVTSAKPVSAKPAPVRPAPAKVTQPIMSRQDKPAEKKRPGLGTILLRTAAKELVKDTIKVAVQNA